MNVSESEQSAGVGRVSGQALGVGKVVLLILPPLLAFFLTRWIGYDIPNLNQPWRQTSEGPPNATGFLGAPGVHFGLGGTYIGTAEGEIYVVAKPLELVEAVPESSRQEMAAVRQKRRPLIPFTLNPPPGEIVDSYQSRTWYGSLLDRGPVYYVILADGTIWGWAPGPDYVFLSILILGAIFGMITLVAVCVLLRLERLWPGTWFWRRAVYSKWELVRRVALSAGAALIPGVVIFGLFSLPFMEHYTVELIGMALLTTVIAVPCFAFIRKRSIATLLPVVVVTGIFFRDAVSGLFTYWNWRSFEWELLLSLLGVGLLAALTVGALRVYFRRTAKGSRSEGAKSIWSLR